MVKSKNTSNQQDNTDSGVSLRQKEIDSILTGGSSQHKAPNLSQKEIDARVGQVLDVLPSMSKQAIKRALEENDYNVGDVVTQILDGVSQWTEVKKKVCTFVLCIVLVVVHLFKTNHHCCLGGAKETTKEGCI